MSSKNKSKYLTSAFFLLLIAIGIFTFRDYGFAFDEAVQRSMGLDNVKYIGDTLNLNFIKENSRFQEFEYSQPTYPDGSKVSSRFYGVAFEILLVAIEDLLGINSERHIYLVRHLITYLVFIFGIYSLYEVAKRRYSSNLIGIFAATILFLTPRFFAESFYNTKDIVFMALFIGALNFTIKAIEMPSIRNIALASMLTALAIDVRMMALILPVVMFFWGFASSIQENSSRYKTLVFYYLIYFSIGAVFVLIFWPWLWTNPYEKIISAIKAGFHFPQGSMLSVLYFGDVINSTNLPWHYVLTWIAFTIPAVCIPFFLLGLCNIVWTIFLTNGKSLKDFRNQQDLLFLLFAILPIAAVIAFKSVMYDTWRHLYFIYPFVLLVAIRGFITLILNIKNKFFIILICIILASNLVVNALWMIREHPFQNVYFNFLAGKNIINKFDVDYWGLSNRRMYEWILKINKNPYIRIHHGSLMNIDDSLKILKENDFKKFIQVDSIDDTDFIITNYRLNDTDYTVSNPEFIRYKDLLVADLLVATIYKRRDQLPAIQPTSKNKDIYFGIDGSGSAGLLGVGGFYKNKKGWSHPEKWGAWSEGEYASVVIPLPPERDVKDIVFDLINPKSLVNVPTNIIVKINGIEVGKYSVSSDSPVQIKVPLLEVKLKNKNFITVEFNILNPLKKFNNLENRELGIGLIKAKFE